MYVRVEPNRDFISREAGTLFLYYREKIWYLYLIIGRTKDDKIVSYAINPVKGTEKEIDEVSLKAAIQMTDKVFDEKINKRDIERWTELYKNVVNINVSVDINKIKAWYLKNKMLNQIEELYFEDKSELRNIGTIHTEDLESGIPYISRDGDIYVYLDKRNGYYNFYYDTPWYLGDSVTISYYANKKYKTLPKFYRMDKLSDKVIIEMARKNAESYLKIKTRKFDIWKVV